MLLGHTESLTSHISFSFLDINRPARSCSGDPQVRVSYDNHSRHNATHYTYTSLLIGHRKKRHDVLDEHLEDFLIVVKIAVASGFENYDILQVRDHPPSA